MFETLQVYLEAVTALYKLQDITPELAHKQITDLMPLETFQKLHDEFEALDKLLHP